MTLLEALDDALRNGRTEAICIPGAKLASFAFTEEGEVAFLSQLPLEVLLPLLEDWCQRKREEQVVH